MRDVKLDDKYTVDDGRVIMSGTHALIRVPLLQKEIDSRNGLNTAGFISGYRGSPLGTYDLELWRVPIATVCSPSGTARGQAWTGLAIRSNMAISRARTRMAVC